MRALTSRTRGACAVAALLLASCDFLPDDFLSGGGGTGSIDSASEGDLDGFVNGAGNAFPVGSGPAVGDIDSAFNGLGNRMFYSFSFGVVPAWATEIVSATLHVPIEGMIGNPFASLGVLVVDHLDYGPTLDGSDYGAPSLDAAFDVLAVDAIPGDRTLDVTSQVRVDWSAARLRSQYRVRFSLLDSDVDGVSDAVLLNDHEDSRGTGRTPYLTLTYR